MGRRPAQQDRSRLSLILTKRTRERLEGLQKASDAESMAEVIRRALALYEDALAHERNGGVIMFEYPESSKKTSERLKLLV
jgi:hypothetical protein